MKVAAYHAGRHLDEGELLNEHRDCPICGHPSRTLVSEIQRRPEVSLWRCQRCYGVSVSRLPTDQALDQYYESYYTSASSVAVTTDDPVRLGQRIARYAPHRSELAVLDFGGGDGSIGMATIEATSRAGLLTVIDYDHRRRAPALAGVTIQFRHELDDVADQSFDLVVASAVLEHLPRPLPVLHELLRLVRPGGSFYARTPYAVPLLLAARRVHMRFDFTFPAHLHDMGQPFWDRLLDWMPLPEFQVLASRPSPVETGVRAHPGRTLAAFALKSPWHLLGRRWPFVGGWEFAIARSRP